MAGCVSRAVKDTFEMHQFFRNTFSPKARAIHSTLNESLTVSHHFVNLRSLPKSCICLAVW